MIAPDGFGPAKEESAMEAPGAGVETRSGTAPVPPFGVRKLTPVIGAEIEGLDLRQKLGPTVVAALRRAWHDHAVLLLRDQALEDMDQIRFGECFGDLGRVFTHREGRHPAILLVSNIRENGKPIGALPDGEMQFHSDQCYVEHPPAGTMLYSIEVPSVGGDTMFASMYAAYDALSDAMKAKIEGLRGINYYDPTSDYVVRKGPPSEKALKWVHPVVRVHPATGRKALYVNRLMTYAIEGMPEAESAALLAALFDHQEQRQFVYQHRWRPGDVVLWDNRCTLHARTDFSSDERRLLRRITVQNEAAA
jgi:alpha-ketoglutarate-dependent taurine dioxygenase